MSNKIKVLIADDSRFFSDQLKALLLSDPDIDVVGVAYDGREAVSMVEELQPDIITMDIEMPSMSGFQAIEAIMGVMAKPILVISDNTNAKSSFEALDKGALEVMSKADVDIENPEILISKIKFLSKIRVVTHIRSRAKARATYRKIPCDGESGIFIASSTGGPKILFEIINSLGPEFPLPVVIAQHMSDGFIDGMVEWIDSETEIKVVTAKDGDILEAGTVYILPTETHTVVAPGMRLKSKERSANDIFHPSCDELLVSAGKVLGSNAIGVILTGMGSDGAKGMETIKNAGGVTIAQDEETCIVFSMPKSAIDKGCVDFVVPYNEVVAKINEVIKSKL